MESFIGVATVTKEGGAQQRIYVVTKKMLKKQNMFYILDSS